MKKSLTKFLALSGICLLMFSACKKDGTLVASNGGTPGALTATSSTLVLNKANNGDAATPVITFNFTQPNYGFQAAVTNTLQIDAPGDNWAKPTSVTLGANALTQSYSTPAFNALLLKLNLAGGVTTTVNARIVQSISTGLTPVYSNVLALTVTPYNLASFIYVVGAFQGWNANNPDSLLSATSNGIYQGIINYTAGNNQFLILPQKGSYNNKIATTQSSTPTSTTLVNANNNLVAPSAAGQYVVTYNSNANTISFALANFYSVIGSTTPGGNYSTDLDFKYTNNAFGDWVGTFAFTAGAFKIRQNHDWTWSWGIPKAGSAGDGVANALNDSSNDNINAAVAGNYKVTFSIPISAQAPGFVPQTVVTYTSVKQ